MSIEWVPSKLLRAYKREPRFDVGERQRAFDEREAASLLHPDAKKVNAAPQAPPRLAQVKK